MQREEVLTTEYGRLRDSCVKPKPLNQKTDKELYKLATAFPELAFGKLWTLSPGRATQMLLGH